MCGIVGVAGNLFHKDEGIIKSMLLFDYLRGKDGSGLASIRCNGDIHIAKIANDPITLFDTIKFNTVCAGTASKAFIGHNRFATRGAKVNANAHPFQHGHITGVHNGTLDTLSWEALEKATGEKFATDSEALYAAIAKLGIKEAIGLCYEGKEGTSGAWSLVWHDAKEDSLNFLRNEHRPMWYGFEEGFQRMFFASEWWMIDAALNVAELKAYVEEGTKFKYFPTDENIHIKIALSDLVKGGDAPPKFETQKIKGKEPPVVAKQDNFPTRQFGFQQTGKPTKKSGSTTTSRSSPSAVIHWLGSETSPYAGYISKEDFKTLSQYGCSWCQADVDYGQPGLAIYESQGYILCPTCAGHDVVDDATATRVYCKPNNFAALL